MGKIVGYEKERKEIAQLREMLKNSARYRKYGIRIPRGIVLYGEPGVGKTVLAKSIAADGISLIELRAANCCEEDAVNELKAVFERAKNSAPAVILLDELDKIAGTSEHFMMEMNDSIKKALLQELDGLNEDDDVLVAATCNDTDSIGEALLRPGRFDRRLHIEAPDEATRRLIVKEYFDRLRMKNDVDYGYIAKITYGYTGAKIECLANETGILAAEKETPCIEISDIRIIMNKFAFEGGEKDPSEDPQMLKRIAVHEAGHALLALKLAPDCLYGASILPQGESCGHIQFINPEDGVGTVSQIENEAAVLLAGHVAERVIYGEYSVGSDSDLRCAAARIRVLTISQAAYGYDGVVLAVNMHPGNIVSEKIKETVSEVLLQKLNEADKKAEAVITENRVMLDSIVEALIKNQTLSRNELFEIKNAAEIKSAA